MNVEQHLKVAQWHIEQARLHATQDALRDVRNHVLQERLHAPHVCGCPLNDEYQEIIDQVDSGNIVDDDA